MPRAERHRKRSGSAYDPAVADQSLKVLFDTGLFSDVRMDWDGMTLTVRVVENPILNQVVYEGNSNLSDTDLNKEVQVRPRMVFTRARVQADVQRIIELYRRSGRFAATVEPKIIPVIKECRLAAPRPSLISLAQHQVQIVDQ